jgi:phosphoribosylanthranilate isomerase
MEKPDKKIWDPNFHYTRIKLCEFETLDSAYEASFLNVDFLGFHIFSDQDCFSKAEKFRTFFCYLPDFIHKTLLSDLDVDNLSKIFDIVTFDSLQLYGNFTIEQINQVRDRTNGEIKIIKVMSEKSEENQMPDDEFISYYDKAVDGFLVDSFLIGGTGITGNWSHCAEIVRKSSAPVFLAGGLTADNVFQAIEEVRPFGVDVENGVGTRLPDGRRLKNMLKCRLFVEKVKEADWRLGRLDECSYENRE